MSNVSASASASANIKIGSSDEDIVIEEDIVICDIKYTGIGSNFRTYFCENEFRNIIYKYMPYFCLRSLTKAQLDYFNEVLKDPKHCSLDLLLEFTGAHKV